MNYKTSLLTFTLYIVSLVLFAQTTKPIEFQNFRKLYATKMTSSEVILYDSLRLVFELNTVNEIDFSAIENQLQDLIDQSVSDKKKWIIALRIRSDQQNELFAQRSVQANFIKFWTNTVAKYKDSEHVIGYQLLTNPSPANSVYEWKNLAEFCLSAIQKIDSKKIIFVNYPTESELSKAFFSLKNDQILYVLSTDYLFPEGNQYFKFPEKQKNVIPNDLEFINRSNEVKFMNGFTEFTLVSTSPSDVNNTENEIVGLPVFTFSKMNLGKVCIGGFSVIAYDENGKLIKDVMQTDPVMAGGKWQFDNTTTTGTHQVIEKYGVFNNKVMCIDVVEDSASTYNEFLYFPVQPKQKISTSAWVQTNYLDYSASCTMSLHFYISKSNRLVLPFDETYLAQELKYVLSFLDKNNLIFEQGIVYNKHLKTKKSQENYTNTLYKLMQINTIAYFPN